MRVMSEARDNAAELRALARAKARYDQQTEGLAAGLATILFLDITLHSHISKF